MIIVQRKAGNSLIRPALTLVAKQNVALEYMEEDKQ
jgi:hypothetical protein